MDFEYKIKEQVQNLLPEYINFLSEFVKFDSFYCNEKEAQLFVKNKMELLGLAPQIYFSRNDEQAINLAVTIKGSENQKYKSLILNSHCDITPVDTPSRWEKPPFSGVVENNILYGRGSLDDKAGITIILLIANLLKNMEIKLKGDLILESVIEDETTGNGSKTLVENGLSADGVIIIDGTWSERIIYAHLGQLTLDIFIQGEPVAACVEYRGINPIYIGMEFIQKVKDFIDELNKNQPKFENIEKSYYINVGSFHSGTWSGSVPAEAKLEIHLGFSEYFTPEQIFSRVKEIANSISERIQVKEALLKTPAFRTDADSYLIGKLKKTIEKNSNKEVLVIPITGFSDMRHFKTKNVCLYGPGGGKNPHGINEHYFLEQMPNVVKNLTDFILEWCNEPK